MSAGVKNPVVAWGETADPEGAPMSVRRSARHCAVPGVAAGQIASTLDLGAAPAAATEGGAPKDGVAKAPNTKAAARGRVTPAVPINPGPPHLPAGAASPPAYT